VLCSIIIRSFNEERHIGRLLDGIGKQELPDGISIEILLVDSGSDDATTSIAAHMGARVIHVAKEDFSFGRALNIGCQQASGEILLFASAHVYPVFTDWIEKMVTPFNQQKVAIVYGRQTGNELTCFSEQQVFNKWFPQHSNYNQANPFCNNANCAIRRSLWLEQPYDETLTGLEDLDWAQKIMSKQFSIVYEADAVIIHVHEETPQKIKNRYRREAIALKQIMPQVHFNFFDFIRLFLFNSFMDGFHVMKGGNFFKEIKNIISFRYMQFYGTYLGHRQKGAVTRDLKNRFYYPNSIAHKTESRGTKPKESKRIQYS
jgi:glycosyltransferase involved in cell wall biosynthesis